MGSLFYGVINGFIGFSFFGVFFLDLSQILCYNLVLENILFILGGVHYAVDFT